VAHEAGRERTVCQLSVRGATFFWSKRVSKAAESSQVTGDNCGMRLTGKIGCDFSRAREEWAMIFVCTPMIRLLLAGVLSHLMPVFLFGADSPSATGGAPARTILVLGDSLAAGHGLEPDQSFPALLQDKIQRERWNFKVINAGLSGDTSAGGLRRLNWLLRQKVDVLVVELGANDGLRGIPPLTTKSNLQAIIDQTKEKYPGTQVVIAGMKMPPNMGETYTRQFEQVFKELAETNKAALVPFLLEGVGGRPDLNQGDRIHPTAKGQEILAENVWKILRPLLQRSVES